MKSSQFNILIVDDNSHNRRILASVLSRERTYSLTLVSSGLTALEAVKRENIDLILLDIMMPEMDGFQVAENLKTIDKGRTIPVIFITADTNSDSVTRAFKKGGVDYITKPFNAEELIARVNVHAKLKQFQDELKEKNKLLESKRILLLNEVNRKTEEIDNISTALITALESANKLNDTDTGNHIKRVSKYAAVLAKKVSNDYDFIRKIEMYASLHDVGKVGIPDSILKNPGIFTLEEKEEMKKHVLYGGQMLAYPGIPKMAANIARYHHEKWDGTGYAASLKGNNIPLEARIVALADVYDALGTKRVYKEAFSEDKINRIIEEGKGKHFDPDLVDIFFKEKDKILRIKKKLSKSFHR